MMTSVAKPAKKASVFYNFQNCAHTVPLKCEFSELLEHLTFLFSVFVAEQHQNTWNCTFVLSEPSIESCWVLPHPPSPLPPPPELAVDEGQYLVCTNVIK